MSVKEPAYRKRERGEGEKYKGSKRRFSEVQQCRRAGSVKQVHDLKLHTYMYNS